VAQHAAQRGLLSFPNGCPENSFPTIPTCSSPFALRPAGLRVLSRGCSRSPEGGVLRMSVKLNEGGSQKPGGMLKCSTDVLADAKSVAGDQVSPLFDVI